MLFVEQVHFKIVTGSVARVHAFSLCDSNNASVFANGETMAEPLITPAESDHFVERRPFEERIVGRMIDREASSAAYLLFERLFDAPRPANAFLSMASLEVANHHSIAREFWLPRIPCLRGRGCWRGCRDVCREGIRRDQHFFDLARSGLPVVIVDAAASGSASKIKREPLGQQKNAAEPKGAAA